ncbi:MAG: DNA polymerase III subunit gamma/tau [Candidatus Acidiferrales bacterium]
MSYKVIARKYRPNKFDEIVGQEHVTRTLANAIRSNRVAHAYIFAGVRGVGKTTSARILAKALNCAKGPTPEPDDDCTSCKEIAAGTSLDVLEIDAASNRGIDQIRELREMVRYAPAAGRYKVVILDEAHQLTDEASNALLKTLEEPPEHVVFILATTEPDKLGDTIKSRAQLFQFRLLSFKEISDQIEKIAKKENLSIDSAAVAVLARAAEGSLRDALSLLEQSIAYSGDTITDVQVRELLGVVAESVLDELIAAIETQSADRALQLAHRLIADGQNLQHFCREAIRHVRNLLVAKVCGASSELIAAPENERPRLAEQSAKFGEEDLTRFFNILVAADYDLRRSPDPRLHLELALLKLINAQRLAPVEMILSNLREGRPPRTSNDPSGTPPRIMSAAAGSAPIGNSQPPNSGGYDGAPSTRPASALPVPAPTQSAPSPLPAPKQSFSSAAPVGAPASATRASIPAPIPASPPRIIARAAEDSSNGLTSAQLDALRSSLRESRLLSSFLECATRCETEAGEFRLFFGTENRTIAEMMPREAMERLRTAVQQLTGQPLRVCVRLESGTGPKSRSAELRARFEEDPVVRAMLERFGGTISNVKPPSEE